MLDFMESFLHGFFITNIIQIKLLSRKDLESKSVLPTKKRGRLEIKHVRNMNEIERNNRSNESKRIMNS